MESKGLVVRSIENSGRSMVEHHLWLIRVLHVDARIVDRHASPCIHANQLPRATAKLPIAPQHGPRDAALISRSDPHLIFHLSSPPSHLYAIVKRVMKMAIFELTETFQNTTLNDVALVFSPRKHARWSNLEL